MNIYPNEHESAIHCDTKYGPMFGKGADIIIADNANTTMDSYSYLGNCYKHRQYRIGTNEAQTFLAGSYQFQLDEIEVYQKNK